MMSPRFLFLVLLLAFAQGRTIAHAQTFSAVPVDTIQLGTTGVRGITMGAGGQVWLLTSTRTGLSVPDSSYVSSLLVLDRASGAGVVRATESDAYECGLAFDGEHLWAGGNRVGGSELIYRIRLEDAVVDSTLEASGYHPGGLTWGEDYLWQVDSDARQISRLEKEQGKISKRIPTPGFYPTGLAHSGTTLYCADAASGLIHRIQTRTGRFEGTIDPQVFQRPGEFVSLAWDGRYLWTIAAGDSFAVRYEVLR